MPTFNQAAFISRALESLRAQTFTDWELVVVDDGSFDETEEILVSYRGDERIRYHRWPRNEGLGAALNYATSLARGHYLAYLPSDDVYYPDHLQRLVTLLDSRPDVYLAYAGVRWGYSTYGPTLQGERAVGHEAEVLAEPSRTGKDVPLPSGNILALVQVMHRRELEDGLRWTTRDERVSDTLEADFWRGLLQREARFAFAGSITCEWVDHPHQRHKLISGLARYRSHYRIPRGVWLNFEPTRGVAVDERERFGQFDTARDLPTAGGLKIMLAGELGFNPERILAFEERGHKLYGLWVAQPEPWDAVGPFSWGNIDDISFQPGWIDVVRALQPDVIYGLLNWQSMGLMRELLDAKLEFPFVFHFKEGPFICQEKGDWPTLVRLLTETDGQIFISQENLDWFQQALDGRVDLPRTLVLDGDLPKQDWMTDEWMPKLSERDGEIHTVCSGRPIGVDPFDELAAAGIHVHFYGRYFQQQFPNWTRTGLATGYMHIHPTVEPATWVRELSQYDAAWFHVHRSQNGGELRAANWDDLNLPARLGTYAAAGLPWILKNNAPAIVAMENLARDYDVGVLFEDFADLAVQLRDRPRIQQLTANMRAARFDFAFDTHADRLVDFFRAAIARRREAR